MAMPQTPPLSAAGTALGLGDLLRDQVSDETDELRRKRLAQLAGRPDVAGLGVAFASPVSATFGGPVR
jgi:hypothetical protein